MNWIIKSLFFIIYFFLSPLLNAQVKDVSFHQIENLNGVSIGSVYKIFQDRSDFLWLATSDGLVKYDGYSYQIFRHETKNQNSLSENWVSDIVEDNNHCLWIATQGGGICKFDPLAGLFKNFLYQKKSNSNIINSKIIRSLWFDGNSNLWIGSQSGVSVLNINTEKLVIQPDFLKSNKIFSSSSINTIHFSQNILYFGSWGEGVLVYDLKKRTAITLTNFKSNKFKNTDDKIKCIVSDSNGLIWIGSRGGGITVYDPIKQTKTFYDSRNNSNGDALNSDAIQSLMVDSRGNIWVGTFDNGLDLINPKTKTIKHFKRNTFDLHSIPSNWVASIFEDRSGLIWFGTDRGIAKIPVWQSNFKLLNLASGISGEYNTNAILQDHQKNYWFGTWGGGLIRVDKNKTDIVNFEYKKNDVNSISNNNVWALAEDKNSQIWIGTSDGLDCLNLNSGKIKKYKHKKNDANSLIQNNVSALLIDSKNNLWVGSWGEGLTILDPSRTKFKRFKNIDTVQSSLSDDFINYIFEDSKQRIWIATAKGGVSLYNQNGTFKTITNPELSKVFQTSNNIESILEDKFGRLWFASNGSGLICYFTDTNKTIFYTQNDGLASDAIHRIIDDDDFLWISTNNGLSSFNLKTNQFENFYVEDGLQANEFNRGAFKSKDGQIFFGGSNGINFFNPKKIEFNKHTPNVVLTSFKRFNSEININKLIKNNELLLSYKDEVLSFEYAALDFHLPEKNLYKVKLEGLDTSWSSATNRRFITYSNLAPGKYVFKIQASNNNQIWNENLFSLKIRITPPFWRTWWFFGLIFSLLIFTLFIFTRIRIYNFIKNQKLLEKMVNDKTAELLNQKEIVEEKNLEILLQKDQIEVQKKVVEEQRDFVTHQRDLIIEQNEELTDSIQYAKRIQSALLNPIEKFGTISKDFFIYFKSRDIVSGDFYYFVQKEHLSFIAITDCTGHGIPGAFMSILGISSLNEIIQHETDSNAARILDVLRDKVIQSLHQTGQIYEANDGMDISFCIIDHKTGILNFAGANHSLLYIKNGELEVIKGDPIPIGIYFKELPFTNFYIQLEENDAIYMLTDGFVDQFGGELGRKFMFRHFKEFIFSIHNLPMNKQCVVLNQKFLEWKGNLSQLDDVLILGFRFNKK